jgi:hypothetical protein
MAAMGHFRTSVGLRLVSVLASKANLLLRPMSVRYGPLPPQRKSGAHGCYRPSIARTSSVVFTSAKTRSIVLSSPSCVSRETSATASLTRMER